MGKERINRTITMEDVKEFNETLPEVIEIYSTRDQKIDVLSKLNSKIKIRIVGNESDNASNNEIYFSNRYYSPSQICSIMRVLEEYEKGLDKHPNWSNLEKSLYIYSRLAVEYSPTENPDENSSSLLALLTLNPDSKGFASIYKEAMDRLGIPCKYIENSDHFRAWNEIMIDGKYYPVDLEMDSRESHSKDEGALFVHNFAKNKEFYYLPEHRVLETKGNEISSSNTLDPELIQKTLDTVVNQIELDQQELLEIIQSEKIPIESKELSGIFYDNTVSLAEAKSVNHVKVNLTDDNFDNLKKDLRQISIHYPNLLNNIELENSTSSKVDMQEVIDYIYSVRFPENNKVSQQTPINITISSSIEEDFDLDFSKVPKIEYDSNTPVDGKQVGQRISFKNLNSTRAINLPKFSGKLSPNIDGISLDGFDLHGLDLTGTNIKELTLKSELTKNVGSIIGIQEIDAITVEALSDAELTAAITNFNVHDLSIANQNLHDRAIFQELSVNPNLAKIRISNSHLNELDGLELFQKKLALLALWRNDINVDDLQRLNSFKSNNPHLSMYVNSNSNIINAINAAPEISDLSYNYIREIFLTSGVVSRINSKSTAVDYLLWDSFNVPYYIGDAEVLRKDLNITQNPMMVENDYQLENFDFDKDYLRDGTLLLTIAQIERLLQIGKVVPQDIRIKLNDVTELSSSEATDIYNRMRAAGMNVVGVQLFDKMKHNHPTQIDPYSLNQYVYIRDTLDMLVDGIDPLDSDIDKFATIYQRLSDFIIYDYEAIKENDTAEALYAAEKNCSSRNLLEGLEEGKCVCAGYADILKNALLLAGIEARINSGRCDASNPESAHAWNQVELDDGTGKKWYYTDLTWDAGKNLNRWTLLGSNNREFMDNHQLTKTLNIETVTPDDFDRTLLKEAFDRARKKSFDFRKNNLAIDIPEDPNIQVEILDHNRISDEYKRRKNDMFAKFYGDRDYQREFGERNERYKEHEIEITQNGITYRTIEDYQEKNEDEQFLLLDKYKECLERMTRYEAGDTSVYQGTDSQIKDSLKKDKEYVETRNHTFDQHKNTQRDLATLGKFGERIPYIPQQREVLRNIGGIVLNAGIFVRNAVSPIYRGIGKYVAQPIHRVITRGKEASPYRNNWYHRMVARRDYFVEINNLQNPGHHLRNGIKSRIDAIFKAQEGNRAVLRAGAADIQDNIMNQERERVLIENLKARSTAFEEQINRLQEQITLRPYASNLDDVREALKNKISERDRLNNLVEKYEKNTSGNIQTDAIDDRQHAIASKEVNTMRVTVIKGVTKGLAARYVGPKIHSWLAERGKVTRPTQVTTSVPETKKRWVGDTYKEERVPIYSDVIDSSKNMEDIMSMNRGKEITGFYSVYGGERGASTYTLTGNEKITAIFQAQGKGGVGLSDKVGLTAPTLTNDTFSSDLLDSSGLLNQNTTLTQLVEALNTGNIDTSTFDYLYVSVGDRYWTKLSDLLEDVTTKVQVGEEVKRVIDVAGHYENYTEMVEKVINTTEVVTDTNLLRVANTGANIGVGAAVTDSVINAIENLRTTTTNTRANKKLPRQYSFSNDVSDIPTSRRAYRRQLENEGR